MGLATELLDARFQGLPTPPGPVELPTWLVENVLKGWETPYARNQPPMSHPLPMRGYLRHPSGLLEGLRQRWPNPIIATVSVNGEFNNRPRLPYQIANCLYRIGRLFYASGEPQGTLSRR